MDAGDELGPRAGIRRVHAAEEGQLWRREQAQEGGRGGGRRVGEGGLGGCSGGRDPGAWETGQFSWIFYNSFLIPNPLVNLQYMLNRSRANHKILFTKEERGANVDFSMFQTKDMQAPKQPNLNPQPGCCGSSQNSTLLIFLIRK